MAKRRGFPWYTGPIVGPIVAILAGGKYAAKGNEIEWDKFVALITIGILAGVALALGDLLSPVPKREPTQRPLRRRQRTWYWLGIVVIMGFGSCFGTAGLIAIDEGLSIIVVALLTVGTCGFVLGLWLARRHRGTPTSQVEE